MTTPSGKHPPKFRSLNNWAGDPSFFDGVGPAGADPSRCWGLGRVGVSAFWKLDAGGWKIARRRAAGLANSQFPNPYPLFRTPYLVPPQIRSKGLLTLGNCCAIVDAAVRSPYTRGWLF
jgi:hypothetical protein